MADATYYISQAFTKQRGKLVGDPQQSHKTSALAIDTARRQSLRKVGAVAFKITGNVEADAWEEPELLFKSGDVPAEFVDQEPSGEVE